MRTVGFVLVSLIFSKECHSSFCSFHVSFLQKNRFSPVASKSSGLPNFLFSKACYFSRSAILRDETAAPDINSCVAVDLVWQDHSPNVSDRSPHYISDSEVLVRVLFVVTSVVSQRLQLLWSVLGVHLLIVRLAPFGRIKEVPDYRQG